MDTPSLLVPAIVAVILVVAPRLLIQSVGRASDGIAQLFVPPDRTLGWPRGVQESDEPWAWREAVAAPSTEIAELAVAPELGTWVDQRGHSPEAAAIEDLEPTTLVVPVHPVRPQTHRSS